MDGGGRKEGGGEGRKEGRGRSGRPREDNIHVTDAETQCVHQTFRGDEGRVHSRRAGATAGKEDGRRTGEGEFGMKESEARK